MEPRGLCDTARPQGTKECKGLKHSLQGSTLGKRNLLGDTLGWLKAEECVCFLQGNLELSDSFKNTKRKNPSFPECSQFSKQSRSQVSEDRQDGAGECGARLYTLSQTSRHSFSEQARPPEERPLDQHLSQNAAISPVLMRTIIKCYL